MAGDLDYIVDVAIAQVDAGAQILDVNVGYPGVDEVAMLPRVVKKLQEAVDVPLQLDSTNAAALEAALRVYNGKAAVNSVNGEEKVLQTLLPVVKNTARRSSVWRWMKRVCRRRRRSASQSHGALWRRRNASASPARTCSSTA